MRLGRTLKHIIDAVVQPEPATLNTQQHDEKLTPNLRALRLSMTISDYLLSMNVPVSEVVNMALDITERYCKRKVSVDISSTLLMFSQDRGDDREPLTLIHTSRPRVQNTMLLQSLQELVREIDYGETSLEQAEKKLHDIITKPTTYPLWLTTIGSAAISAGVGALLSGSITIIVVSFIVGGLVSLLLTVMYKYLIPAFFSQVIAASVITVSAAAITRASNRGWFDFLIDVNPNLIVIGGIVMLVAGLAIVGAVQDAIDEFYVTANARLLRVFMMTAGIVTGVMIGLYIATQLGISMRLDTATPVYNAISWQLVGAVLIAAGYALSIQSRFKGILMAGAMGALSWYLFAVLNDSISSVAASGVAAAISAGAATLVSRWLQTPSVTLITAGIIPLVPGLSLFNGLMQIIQDTSMGASIDQGIVMLLNALLIALAIAAGASFGNLVTRPLRHTLVRMRNALPRHENEVNII